MPNPTPHTSKLHSLTTNITSNMADDSLGHLGLLPQCGICDDAILRHERVIALIGDRDSTSYRGHTRPFPFPQAGHTITRVDGFLQCRYQGCTGCAKSPEFIPIHCDCCEIFKANCHIEDADVLSRLWTFAAWKKPWRGTLPIHLANRGIDLDMLKRTARFAGLPLLCKLPMELLEMIRGYSQYSLFWRCISVLLLANRVSVTGPEPLMIMPLSQILSWERNGSLSHGTSESLPPAIRLTINSGGITKIESLSCEQRYSRECYDHSLFIVLRRELISDVTAQLQNGLLRLRLPPRIRSLPIWNTPDPPNLSFCLARPAVISKWTRFTAVEMDKVRGITFFFSSGWIKGIHVHHSEESSAQWAFERFSRRPRRVLVWIHLAIPKDDRLLVLGVREHPDMGYNILARTQLSGDAILGRHMRSGFKDRCLAKQAPITLIHGEPGENRAVPYFGAYSASAPCPGLPRRFPVQSPGPSPIDGDPFLSWAPLEGVSWTRTFYDKGTGFCRGIMLGYENGGSRTVGECRLHVDATKTVVQPDRICFRIESHRTHRDRVLYRVEAEFEHSLCHEQSDQEWKCRSLCGFVKFWFTYESSFLVVEN
ncbi:hypothetical protein CEP54_013128 [Fusarium duplospermum]|uniref:Uncharacterized protein n=1 Tax=Fusarium duplospermum TaxID=1325734 RepID=A0A428P4W3_9HYPO|nr:hypothetical protein CEP54_013128 [Fusarium duplospermum]